MAETTNAANRFGFLSTRARGANVRFILVGLLMIAFCALSIHTYMSVMKTIRDRDSALTSIASLPDLATVAEGTDLENISAEFALLSRASALAMQSTLLAAMSERYPVAHASSLAPIIADAMAARGAATASDAADEYELDPPSVEVVAIVIQGKDRMAMINVLGEDTGLIVRRGTKFSAGTAVVTKINEGSVAFSWMDREFKVEMRP